MSRIIAGIGFRRDCPGADIVAVINEASTRSGQIVDALAVPSFKADELGAQEAARQLQLPLIRIERAALHGAQGRCLTRSETARRATGFACVAEACALAAGGDNARLILARITCSRATCALAEQP